MKNLGSEIKSLRQAKNWAQSIVADLLDISVPAYSKIENNVTIINVDRLQQLADIFNVPVTRLIYGEKVNEAEIKVKELEKVLAERDAYTLGLQKKLIDLYQERLNNNMPIH